jgi:hypothetical protein
MEAAGQRSGGMHMKAAVYTYQRSYAIDGTPLLQFLEQSGPGV